MNEQQSPETSTRDVKSSPRRRFLGTGAKVAPVAATLLSQPALATTCFTPSRALSANSSAVFRAKQKSLGQDFVCSNPGSVWTYKTYKNKWPKGCDPTNVKFKDLFGGSDGTLAFTIMKDRSSSIEAAFLAALLNIRGGNGASISGSAINETKLKTMWLEWKTNSKYQLYSGGPSWNEAGIKNYFYSNNIVGTGT